MSAKKEIEVLINRSREAQKQIENYTQEQVDELIRAMVWSVAKPGIINNKDANAIAAPEIIS